MEGFIFTLTATIGRNHNFNSYLRKTLNFTRFYEISINYNCPVSSVFFLF